MSHHPPRPRTPVAAPAAPALTRERVRARGKPMSADEAEQLRAEVRELTTRLAHQLGNLLQVVHGNLELIGQRTSDETTLRYLGNARTAADQLAELARTLPTDPPG